MAQHASFISFSVYDNEKSPRTDIRHKDETGTSGARKNKRKKRAANVTLTFRTYFSFFSPRSFCLSNSLLRPSKKGSATNKKISQRAVFSIQCGKTQRDRRTKRHKKTPQNNKERTFCKRKTDRPKKPSRSLRHHNACAPSFWWSRFSRNRGRRNKKLALFYVSDEKQTSNAEMM